MEMDANIVRLRIYRCTNIGIKSYVICDFEDNIF